MAEREEIVRSARLYEMQRVETEPVWLRWFVAVQLLVLTFGAAFLTAYGQYVLAVIFWLLLVAGVYAWTWVFHADR